MSDRAQVPIRTLAYTVSRADALAFAVLRHELTAWDKLRLLLLISVAGLLAGIVPRDIGPALWWTSIVALLVGAGVAAVVWTNLDVRRKAATLPIVEGQATLDQWEDRLIEHRLSGTRQVDVDRIVQVVCTDRHIFIREGALPVIIPLAAFRDQEDMQDFAADIDERSRQALA